MTRSARINTCAHMGMAWHEIYTIFSRFSRASKSSLDAARTMVLSQAQTLLSGQTSSRIPCPSQRKHKFPTCFPWMVCIAALGVIFQKNKRKGPGTYRPASLTSVSGKITQPVILGCISKHVKNKTFEVVINMDLQGTSAVQQTCLTPTTK